MLSPLNSTFFVHIVDYEVIEGSEKQEFISLLIALKILSV